MSSQNSKKSNALYRMPNGHKCHSLADKEFEGTIKQAAVLAMQNAGKMAMKGLKNIDDLAPSPSRGRK